MSDPAAVQRRTVAVLCAGQVLGGLSFGATVSLGAVLAARISGDDSLSGLATAAITLGTALTAIPLAALARARGRRPALTTGMAIALAGVGAVLLAAATVQFVVLLAGFALIGAGQAANLQSRFAAVDLATDTSRGRDLALVVWTTTVGAVLGPNLVGPGEALGATLGMPPLTGPYLFTVVAQALGIALYLVALRPDPLLLAQAATTELQHDESDGSPDRPQTARYATWAIIAAHGVMVSIMAMTPVHLLHHGATLSVIGLTLSLHIAGMYAAAPLFGLLADRWGRVPVILLGCAILTGCVALLVFGSDDASAVTVSLVLLGLGWSGVTVAGSALLTEASAPQLRTHRQGRTDFAMSLVAAVGATGAGWVLSRAGFDGLALSTVPVLVAVALLAPTANMATRRRAQAEQASTRSR